MSEFTVEEVRAQIGVYAKHSIVRKMLRAYADSIERAQKGITLKTVKRAFAEYTRVACIGDEYGNGNGDGLIAMYAALFAVWPSVTEPVIADAEDAARYRHLREDDQNFAVFMPREDRRSPRGGG